MHGPHEHNSGLIGGTVHTYMDSFRFSVTPLFCTEYYWSIELPDPIACLELGCGRVTHYRVPKIHLDPDLTREYHIANEIYSHYNTHDDTTKITRFKEQEKLLGLDRLPAANNVMEMIIMTYRSYPQKGTIPRSRKKKNSQSDAKNLN